jgi:methenyltetrahydromethanopterin cyclohydrolase
MTIGLNDRAFALVRALSDEADALRVRLELLENGATLIDCGASVPGGLEAGRRFGEVCMGGLGTVAYAPLSLAGRWFPGVAVSTDHPALACLGSQYAGWKIDRDGYFAMASGPGRALVRAEDLYDDLEVDERSPCAVFCLETREPPPEAVAAFMAERAGVKTADLTIVFAPTASLAGSAQIAARVVETALHKLHELKFDVNRVISGFGSCPLPPVAKKDPDAIGRTNDAVLYGGQVELLVEGEDDELAELVPRLPSSASDGYGQPFGKLLEDADWDFYKIDPLLFSPAEIRLVNSKSGRSFQAGGVDLDVLERSFRG